MKKLLYISLFISGWVVLNELSYLGRTDLALVIVGLAIAIGLQAAYLLKKDVSISKKDINKNG